jgi:hypothetical protein
MNPLQLVSDRQGVWSATANRLKARYERARWMTFALSIGGAVLGTIASQLDGDQRTQVAILGAVLFAIAGFLTARALGSHNATRWLRARAASEALKREGYKYAAGAAPYDDPATRNSKLNHEREEIEKTVDEMLGDASPEGRGSAPKGPMSPEEYIQTRVQKQISEYFEPKANSAQRTASALRWVEAGLALAAACLTAIVGVIEKDPLGWGFDFVALTAVITAVSAMVVAHMEAGRYDFTVASYRSTARRLRNALAGAPESFVPGSPEWSAFVNECEGILWEANNTWIAKWTSPSERPPAPAAASK